jgi:hypothetical protein
MKSTLLSQISQPVLAILKSHLSIIADQRQKEYRTAAVPAMVPNNPGTGAS